MIPEIKCMEHPDQDIIMVDLSNKVQLSHRTICSHCMEDRELKQLCPIDKLPAKVEEYGNTKSKIIIESCISEKGKLEKIRKQLSTLKDKSNQFFEKSIQNTQQLLTEINKKIQEQQSFSQNMLVNLTRTKLENLAEILSAKNEKEFMRNQLEEKYNQLENLFAEKSQVLVKELTEAFKMFNSVLFEKKVLQNTILVTGMCLVLASNKEKGLIIGGVNKNIYIWEWQAAKLIEQAILKGHSDIITAIAIFKKCDMFISGAATNAKSIKLWRKVNDQWKNVYQVQGHSTAITALHLTKEEDLLISSVYCSAIMIFQINIEKNSLYLLQIFSHQQYYNSISLNNNEDYIVSSGRERLFQLYIRQPIQKKPFKHLKSIETIGKVDRLYFLNNDDLLCEFQDLAKLTIFRPNENRDFEAIQDISLTQICEDIYLNPIFSHGNTLYCTQNKMMFVIKKSKFNIYYVDQEIPGEFRAGCQDVTGERILLCKYINETNGQIEIYGQHIY